MPERRDALISRLREIEKQIENHEHPTNAQGERMTDLFCLNLTSWIGERAHFILEHIDALEQELEKAKEDRDFHAGVIDY